MAWFEIMYAANLKKKKSISRYEKQKYKPLIKLKKTGQSFFSLKETNDKKISGLINMNNGRIKMREALGFSAFDNTRDVIDSQLLLETF